MNSKINNEKSRGYSQSFQNKSLILNQSNNSTHISKNKNKISFNFENENNETQKLYSKISNNNTNNLNNNSNNSNNNSNNNLNNTTIHAINNSNNHSNTNNIKSIKHSKDLKSNNFQNQSKVILTRYVDEEEWQKASENRKINSNENHVSKKLSQAMKQGPISLDNGKLSLVGCYITEIDLLPEKLALIIKTLYLSHNSLTSLQNLQQFRYLTSVSLANNSIRYLHMLTPLSPLNCTHLYTPPDKA